MQHLATLLTVIGYGGFFLILFLETALPVCFFLPGDSLLLSAGVLASQGIFSFPLLLLIGIGAAIAGGYLGFFLGTYLGIKVFSPEKKGLFSEAHRVRAERFYGRYGVYAIILGRFVPIVRTFVPTLAGIARMPRTTFGIANAIGAILWLLIITALGFFVGTRFPFIVSFIPYAFAGVIVLSFIPLIIHTSKRWLQKNKE